MVQSDDTHYFYIMATTPNITVEQLAKTFGELSSNEKIELLNLLPDDWFGIKEYQLSGNQKKLSIMLPKKK